MTALHHKLNLDVSTALKKSFSLQALIDEIENSDRPGHIWRFDAQDFFDPDWHQTMYNLGMNFGSSLVFYRKAHYIHPTAHIDLSWSDKRPTVSAINWCVSTDDGDMIWYNEKTPAAETEQDQLLTPANTLYVERELVLLEEITRYQIGSTPTLVRTDVFHNVEVRAHPRLCISARCRTIPVIDELTWENVVEFYKPFII